MEEKNQGKKENKRFFLLDLGPFILGIAMAAAFGYYVFPEYMMEEKKQPMAFNHITHIENAGMVCTDCHFLYEDGNFSGVPGTAACAECHSSAITESEVEARFILDYVDRGNEIKNKWLIYQKQPDNVFFSHAAHNFDTCTQCHPDLYETEQDLCNQCHPDVASTTKPPVYEENKLSGYTKYTMKMPTCESCHAHPDHYDGMTRANNACFTCHK